MDGYKITIESMQPDKEGKPVVFIVLNPLYLNGEYLASLIREYEFQIKNKTI